MEPVKVWAIIENGKIINTVLIRDSDFKDPKFIWVDLTPFNNQPGINWSYDGVGFTAPPETYGEGV